MDVKRQETFKADSNKIFDIKIDNKKGHIKSYIGNDPSLIGYSQKTMILHEIESDKIIEEGQTLKRMIKNDISIKSSKIKNEKVKKTLEKINENLPELYIKMDKELAQKSSSEFYNSLTEKEKRATLDFCNASFNGFAPQTCEDYIPKNEDPFIIEIDKRGKAYYHEINDTYFENLFLDDRIYLDAPSKSKVKGCRTIIEENNKLFFNEAPYFRTKKPKNNL